MRTICKFPCKRTGQICSNPAKGRCWRHPVGKPFPAWYVRELASTAAREAELAAEFIVDVPPARARSASALPVPDLTGERSWLSAVASDVATVALGPANARFYPEDPDSIDYLEAGFEGDVLAAETGYDGAWDAFLLKRDGVVWGVEIVIDSPALEQAAKEMATAKLGPEPKGRNKKARQLAADWNATFKARHERLLNLTLPRMLPEGEPEVLGTVEIAGRISLSGADREDPAEVEVPRGTYAAVRFRIGGGDYPDTRIGLYRVEV